VTSAAVNDRRITTASEFVTEAALRETNLTLFPQGTVVMAMYGEGKTRGKAATLELAATTNQALAALEFTPPAVAVRPWLLLCLEHHYERTRRMSSGGVQPNLNLSLVRSITLPLPPLGEQRRLCALAEQDLSYQQQMERTASVTFQRLSRLRQSILKWAFEGKVADQNPNDEPASVLVERIKKEQAALEVAPTRRGPSGRSRARAA
jgi:type I restriction enzyme S subunit